MSIDVPVVWWLYGPPCVGKSTTAWQLYAHLLTGQPRAFFDVDQIGICYPEPEGDPGRHRLKTRTAVALVRRFVGAGAETVLVSGVLDEESLHEVPAAIDGVPVIFCRLRVEAETLRRRLEERYGADAVARALAEAQHWDRRDSGHAVVDSDSGTPREVAQRVLQAVESRGPAPRPATPRGPRLPMASSPVTDPERAVLICGPTGVGNSTLGFGLFTRLVLGGPRSAYLDLQQISFVTPACRGEAGDDQRLTASCVMDLWQRGIGRSAPGYSCSPGMSTGPRT